MSAIVQKRLKLPYTSFVFILVEINLATPTCYNYWQLIIKYFKKVVAKADIKESAIT
jgi:hypothetical protein